MGLPTRERPDTCDTVACTIVDPRSTKPASPPPVGYETPNRGGTQYAVGRLPDETCLDR